MLHKKYQKQSFLSFKAYGYEFIARRLSDAKQKGP